jgi:hypothetical protein
LGRGKRTNDAMVKALMNNPNVWFTTKELGWVMRETCGTSANGKSLCRRLIAFDDGDEAIGGGRIERLRLSKQESQWLSCHFKYRWCPPD